MGPNSPVKNNSFKSFAEESNKFRVSFKQKKIDVACDSLQAHLPG